MSTRIKAILKARGATVHSLHKLLGGNRTNVYLVAGGMSKATVPMRARLAAALNVGVEDIFDENGMAKK